MTPPGHWNLIAHSVAEAQSNTLLDNARLFAVLDMALADAAVIAWDAKYAFNFWRPITAIRRDLDPAWEPLIVTPPFPTCITGHSTFSGTAAAVLGSLFGSDTISFTTESDDLPHTTRSFTSFSQAANEAGRSRIYGGIHYEFDNRDALAAGTALGQYVAANFLLSLGGPGPAPRLGSHSPKGQSVLLQQAPLDPFSASMVGFSAEDGRSRHDELLATSLTDVIKAGVVGTSRSARSPSPGVIGGEGAEHLRKQQLLTPSPDLIVGMPEWQEQHVAWSPSIAGSV